jgi:hypothetical protein
MTGSLYEDQFTFLIIFRSNLFGIKNVSENVVEKIKTPYLFSTNFFTPKIFYFMLAGPV